MSKEVVISNSTLNCYGFRVLTSGIDYSQYEKNPILLWMHNRPWEGKNDDNLPIGHMENLRVDGDNLIGTPVFDTNDEFAAKIASKWENGHLRMASAGLAVIETSDDPAVLVQGQRRPTVTKSKLIEVSIVDIGANDDALQMGLHLYKDTNEETIQLSAYEDCNFESLGSIKQHLNDNQMNDIALKLGLAEDASLEEVLEAITNLQNDCAEVVELRAAAQEREDAAIASVVDEAIDQRKLTADNREHFVALGHKIGLEELGVTLSAMNPLQKPTDIIKDEKKDEVTKLSNLSEEEVISLKENDPEQYAALYKAEYGIELKK